MEPRKPSSEEDTDESADVKSKVIVKYTAVQSPVDFARLQCNTDLNLPPSNWQSAIESYGLKQILKHSTEFSSFTMAHMFPDCVGEVDVISGAECIKTLLKLPYQPKSEISMMVHRIENTILLDDFDIYECLMKSSEWKWLKNFFYENIMKTMNEQERMIAMKGEGVNTLQLVSKFLCHSVVPSEAKVDIERLSSDKSRQVLLDGPTLPEPENITHDGGSDVGDHEAHVYNRNVLWTFEDIQMLIGSDLPIFGGTDRPCVSLRLRDATKPINVLTGIDYWLDNLMCNVPEVLMCYHIDGIVQRYEPMKTEDLPNLEGSKFSPNVVRNVAQNILSFLKSNATKSGHTYWLFKGENDDVVKLYDLTSLCGGLDSSDSTDNPFTTPVAMLLYRVARNMRLTGKTRHVKVLLENALKLLAVEKHPQIVASSYYMLADLYLPANTNPAMPEFKDDTSDSSECEEDHEDIIGGGDSSSRLALPMNRLAIDDIGKKQPENEEDKTSKPNKETLGTHPPERCGKALLYSLKGLEALHHITVEKCEEEEKERIRNERLAEEQNPKMANPYEPIKMNYQPLNTHTKKSKKRKKNELKPDANPGVDRNAIVTCSKSFNKFFEPNRNDNYAWKLHLKTLLYEKICLTYSTLAEYSYKINQYGFSLKYIDLAEKCQFLLSNMIIKSRVVEMSCLYGRAGDNYFQISKDIQGLDIHTSQLLKDHVYDQLIKQQMDVDLEHEIDVKYEQNIEIRMPKTKIEAMEMSCNFYRLAIITTLDSDVELMRRLASVNNELGVAYMFSAQAAFMKYYNEVQSDKKLKKKNVNYMQYEKEAKLSMSCLKESAGIFSKVNDAPNLALIYVNLGRYMRFKVHCSLSPSSESIRTSYNQAEQYYEDALRTLNDRNQSPKVWDTVCWEWSSATYAKATIMQENPESYNAEEVADALKHALEQCDLKSGPRQYLYQFRAGMIWHRLGSLYHSLFRKTRDCASKRRAHAQQASSAYEQSSSLFAMLEDTDMFLTVQLEHIALLEAQANESQNIRLRCLQLALNLLLKCSLIIKQVSEKEATDVSETKTEDRDDTIKSTYSLLSLYESRLQYVLKNLIQYCMAKSMKDLENYLKFYKSLYSLSLKIGKFEEGKTVEYAGSLSKILLQMQELNEKFDC